MTEENKGSVDFVKQASSGSQGVVGEFFGYLKTRKKIWLIPIILSFVVIWGLILVGGTSAAPWMCACNSREICNASLLTSTARRPRRWA